MTPYSKLVGDNSLPQLCSMLCWVPGVLSEVLGARHGSGRCHSHRTRLGAALGSRCGEHMRPFQAPPGLPRGTLWGAE